MKEIMNMISVVNFCKLYLSYNLLTILTAGDPLICYVMSTLFALSSVHLHSEHLDISFHDMAEQHKNISLLMWSY